MDLTLIRSFLAVAESGAITEAAERIGITQPALSRRIQQLEGHLGVGLLVRGRKGAVLTEIGRLVQSEAQGIVARYEQMREMVSSQQRLEGGTVRIGGGATAVSFILPEAIAAFQAAHPQVRFHMREAGSALRQIIDGKLRDAGVEVNVVMELRSIPAILRMVSTTGNLAFVSQLGMEQQGDVIAVPVQGLRIERRLAVIARRGVTLSPAANAFKQRLQSLQ